MVGTSSSSLAVVSFVMSLEALRLARNASVSFIGVKSCFLGLSVDGFERRSIGVFA